MYVPVNLPLTVRAGSLWIAYDAKSSLQAFLPDHLKICPVSLLEGDAPKKKLLFNSYSLTSDFMRGNRLEVVTVAQEKRTGDKCFVILDCYTDTLRWNPQRGIQVPNAMSTLSPTPFNMDTRLYYETRPTVLDKTPKRLVHKYSWEGRGAETKRSVWEVEGTTTPNKRKVTREFVVDSNRKCYFANSKRRMPLTFDEEEVSKPVTVLRNVTVRSDLWSSHRSSLTHSFVHTDEMRYFLTEVG